MCEHSNASAAAALREARRRKILENSASRLKLIESINSSHVQSEPEPFVQPQVRKTNTLNKETSSSELNSKISDFIKKNEELKEISDFLLKENDKVHEDEVNDEEEADVGGVESERGNPVLKSFLQKRLHYILLALAVNLLFYCNAGYLFYENIFCPFYSLKTIELISRKGEKDFQPVLSLVVAGLPNNVQKFAKLILTLAQALLSDLCIYLFTFVIGAKIINNEY